MAGFATGGRAVCVVFLGGGQITVWIYCGGGLENNSRFGTRGAGGMCGFEGGAIQIYLGRGEIKLLLGGRGWTSSCAKPVHF